VKRVPACWRAALADRRGGVALIFAMLAPVLIVVVCGAIDLASVNGDRSKAQDAADAAALLAARQLAMADATGVQARVKTQVDTQLAAISSRFKYTVAMKPDKDKAGATVVIDGRRTSFFGNLLPPGGWEIHAEASASAMGQVALCVLASGKGGKGLTLEGGARITAANCMVHGNADIAVSSTAWLQAAVVQSSGLAAGRISPAPQVGAPAIDDPFDSMNLTPPKTLKSPTQILGPLGKLTDPVTNLLCNPTDLLYSVGVQVLQPGVHCGRIDVNKNATVRLLPGEHYFLQGGLALADQAVLEGADVVLIFDDTSQFKFAQNSDVDLVGRKSGNFAGFVLATTRKNTGVFEISSDHARQLLGTIYIPQATLLVTGTGNRVADQSDWTVVVAKAIKMTGTPNLVINSNYAGSPVPVPSGVGDRIEGVTLTR
jgi:hypothetical protein